MRHSVSCPVFGVALCASSANLILAYQTGEPLLVPGFALAVILVASIKFLCAFLTIPVKLQKASAALPPRGGMK